MKKSLFIINLFLISSLSAVLPPVWQDVAELKEILNDKRLNQYLDSAELIQSIDRIEGGWKITTNRSSLIARIQPQPQSMPGPEKFSITFER
jgi:hypothetical protein